MEFQKPKRVRTLEDSFIYRGSLTYILLLLRQRISYVIPTTSLYIEVVLPTAGTQTFIKK